MMADLSLLAAVALGHLCLVVLAINIWHGLGSNGRWLERATLVVLALALAAPVAVLAVGGRPWSDWPVPLRLYAAACLAVGWLGLPAVTIRRALRRVPPGIEGDAETLDLTARVGADRLIGQGRFAGLLRLPGNAAWRLQLLDWRVTVPLLPTACEGLSLVHLSDLHFARCFDRLYFETIIAAAATWEADLIVFTGDLIDDEAAAAWIVPLLSRLRGRCGQFAILGNHDQLHHPRRIAHELRRSGFEVVDGRWMRLDLDGATVALGGTSAPWGPALDPGAMPEADFRLLLSHTPDLFPEAVAWGIDLMLAGHVHGGQVRLPVVGPVLMPSRYSRRYDRGFFQAGRTLLHVSQGVAGKHPIRFGCLPEISRLTLRAAAPRSEAALDDRPEESLALPGDCLG
ncbi:MAG: metallophosphoesterase [Isosphaeraceae bacterium]|nr:metallophosphoesterase [Isosphaeraceae bacterium]